MRHARARAWALGLGQRERLVGLALGGDKHRTDPDGFGAQSVPGRADGSTLLGFDPTAKPGPLRSVELPWNTETAIKLLTEHRYR